MIQPDYSPALREKDSQLNKILERIQRVQSKKADYYKAKESEPFSNSNPRSPHFKRKNKLPKEFDIFEDVDVDAEESNNDNTVEKKDDPEELRRKFEVSPSYTGPVFPGTC